MPLSRSSPSRTPSQFLFLKSSSNQFLCLAQNESLPSDIALFTVSSSHSVFLSHHEVTVKDNKTLLFGEKAVTVFGIWNPEEVPWSKTGAQVIVEPAGVFTDKEKATANLKGGATKVIIPGPTKDDPILVVGVNGKEYKPDLDGLPPLAKDIRGRLGLVEDLMATVHSLMATQKTVDGPSGKDGGVGSASSSTNILPIIAVTKLWGMSFLL